MNISIDTSHREMIAQKLGKFLADSYVLYVKYQHFHWDVTGPLFHAIHEMTQSHYEELATAIDEIAEVIRSLGSYPPGTLKEFLALTTLEEEEGHPSAVDMLGQLISVNELLIHGAQQVLSLAAEAEDVATEDLLTQRIALHRKNAWMLRSLAGEE